jgi:hypothetical protein
VVTRTSTTPGVVVAGTTVEICVSESTVNHGTESDPKVTLVAAVKPDPVIVMGVAPAVFPVVEDRLVMEGNVRVAVV